MTSKLANRNFLWLTGILIAFSIIWLNVLYFMFEEQWDEQGTGKFSKILAGNLVEIKTKEKKMRIKLAFVDAPSSKSVHGRDAIQYLKNICEHSSRLDYRVKKVGNQYIGEIKRDSVVWDLSLNRSLIKNGLVRVDDQEKGEWKQAVVNHYMKSENMIKSVQKGVWAYKGYVTKDGFNPVIEKQIVVKAEQLAK